MDRVRKMRGARLDSVSKPARRACLAAGRAPAAGYSGRMAPVRPLPSAGSAGRRGVLALALALALLAGCGDDDEQATTTGVTVRSGAGQCPALASVAEDFKLALAELKPPEDEQGEPDRLIGCVYQTRGGLGGRFEPPAAVLGVVVTQYGDPAQADARFARYRTALVDRRRRGGPAVSQLSEDGATVTAVHGKRSSTISPKGARISGFLATGTALTRSADGRRVCFVNVEVAATTLRTVRATIRPARDLAERLCRG